MWDADGYLNTNLVEFILAQLFAGRVLFFLVRRLFLQILAVRREGFYFVGHHAVDIVETYFPEQKPLRLFDGALAVVLKDELNFFPLLDFLLQLLLAESTLLFIFSEWCAAAQSVVEDLDVVVAWKILVFIEGIGREFCQLNFDDIILAG